MGAVFKPNDISNKNKKKNSNKSIKDINPETNDSSNEIKDWNFLYFSKPLNSIILQINSNCNYFYDCFLKTNKINYYSSNN